jgi:DNA-directed RNA polymerase alpha subunit
MNLVGVSPNTTIELSAKQYFEEEHLCVASFNGLLPLNHNYVNLASLSESLLKAIPSIASKPYACSHIETYEVIELMEDTTAVTLMLEIQRWIS